MTPDILLALDRAQRHDAPGALRCAKDPKHGTLFVVGDGKTLLCGQPKCTYATPVPPALLAEVGR